MTLTKLTMTDEQRKSVAIEYFKAFGNGGKTWRKHSRAFRSRRRRLLPEMIASGREEIGRMFADLGSKFRSISHHIEHFNWIFSGSDLLACERTSHGEHEDGPWRVGIPEYGAGRRCDIFEIRDWLIQRVFIHLDSDYACRDTARYPWLADKA
jgi:hypothetical protein